MFLLSNFPRVKTGNFYTNVIIFLLHLIVNIDL